MSCFAKALSNSPEYRQLLSCIGSSRLPLGALGLPPVAKSHIIFSLCEDIGRRALVIMPDESAALKAVEDINTFSGGKKQAVFYPSRDYCYISSQCQSKEFEHLRLNALNALLSGECSIAVCSAAAALQYTLPPEELKNRTISFRAGDTVPVSSAVESLVAAGYSRTDEVEGSGQFALRGGILDIFTTSLSEPVRIEFWGDEIDTISFFDVATQRRTDKTDSITVSPATEILFDSPAVLAEKITALASGLRGKSASKAKESLLFEADAISGGAIPPCLDKYLPICYNENATLIDYCKDAMLFVCESSDVKNNLNSSSRLQNEDIKALFEDGVLTKGLDCYSLTPSQLFSVYESMGAIFLDSFPRGSFDVPVKELLNFTVYQQSPWSGTLGVLLDDIIPAIRQGNTVAIIAGTDKSAVSLAEALESEGVPSVYFALPPSEFSKKRVNVLAGGLSYGFTYPNEKLLVVSYGKMSQVSAHKKRAVFKAADAVQSLEELERGDYVVHTVHGIGMFEGVQKIEMNGLIKDYIKIKYDKSDVLYVPVTQLDLISKYIGQVDENKPLKLNRLGSKEWEKTKQRVKGSVKDIAKELIELYSKRLKTKGFAFSPDIDMQNDFERRFPFDETDDQLRCIDEIKHDMERLAPMDRLLCGDVGFGKTEVALRAAFKCIADGMQCAILVPTTILAFQHYQTILKRFEGFPINVEMISRFRSSKEQAEILKKLKRGTIDLLVGTHRLISKDVEFHKLGLLIVDEEQRFGVAQKERLKELFPTVDALTLSATPIPRTMNMAMTGIRDMSVIEEAPNDRFPVQTYVLEYDFGTICEAIKRELRRGGQVYYLYNHVDTIDRVAAKLKEELPEAKIAIGHGKMNEEQLSTIWRSLIEGEIDVLVCTTIIETGVDVPNVNTLIIDGADRMGLSQLHQIRGRVGRSTRRAFAYLTYRRDKQLSEIATRRLQAIREYTEFGSGFKIAMRDLEIRGAGNMLGAQQHGHMEAVGYDMYIKLLTEAISEEKGEAPKASHKECLVDVQIDAHIPEKYIESLAQRLSVYKRIAAIENEDDASDVLDELIDRFGDPPKSVAGLITISLLRTSASELGIYEIGQKGSSLLFYSKEIKIEAVQALAKNMRGRIMVSNTGKSYISVKKAIGQTPLDTINETLKIMSEALTATAVAESND